MSRRLRNTRYQIDHNRGILRQAHHSQNTSGMPAGVSERCHKHPGCPIGDTRDTIEVRRTRHMVARTADLMGIDQIGIGSDLCQDQPDSVVEWMRVGRWTKEIDYGEGSASDAGFPPMPAWFGGNRDFGNIASGLRSHGFAETEITKIMGENWLAFFANSFGSAT